MREVPFIDLQRAWASQHVELIDAIEGILRSGQFILGDEVRLLEKEMSEWCGAGDAVGVASGTDALVLLLHAAGIGAGDEVITSPFTFFATAEAIILAGATPIFADVDAQTFNVDPDEVSRRIGPRTKAILPVHLFGQMADMRQMSDLAHAHGLQLFEDACQAIGAEWESRSIGAWSQGAAVSFFPTKNLGTCGDGGIVIVQDPDVARRIRSLRVHGSEQKYVHERIGWNSRLDEIHAAVLRIRMKEIDRWNEERRRIALHYHEALSVTPMQLPVAHPDASHVYHLYTVVTEERDELQRYLQEAGIGTGVYYPLPLHLQPALSELGYRKGDFPVVEHLSRCCLSLPMFPGMSEQEVEAVSARIIAFYRRR